MRFTLGDISFGSDVLTGPTSFGEELTNSLPEHAVVRGKPVVQDTGEELDKRSFAFFFDETFCEPEAELAKLRAAHASRSALALVPASGAYRGKRFVVVSISPDIKKTRENGRVTRVSASMKLKEATGSAISGPAIASLAIALVNPLTRR